MMPQGSGRAWNGFSHIGIGVLHQTAAIEAACVVAAITIRHADLLDGNLRCLFADCSVGGSGR